MNTEPTTLHIKLDWRFIVIVLLLVIAGMLYFWHPWQAATPARTITVQGEAVIQKAPDSFVFEPTFENEDVKAVTASGNDAVAHLKQLGVADADIQTSVNSASTPEPLSSKMEVAPIVRYPQLSTYTITATVNNKTLAQKVADYLATTGATGQVTPSAQFSKATRSKLDLEARSQASDDAKAKAAVTAKQLGAKVGRVITISDSNGYGIMPMDSAKGAQAVSSSANAGPTIEPGTNEVSYTFTVEFELK